MGEELSELKKELGALVVSSPSQVDVRALLRSYEEIKGGILPIAKYGYHDPVKFLVECCSDSFQFQGPPDNPILVLIATDNLKHFDKNVKSQRISYAAKVKERGQSVQGISCSPAVFASKPSNNRTKERVVKDGESKESKSTSPTRAETPYYNNNNSNNSLFRKQVLFQVKANLKELVFAYPQGVLYTDLLTLYRVRFGKKLKFYSYGYSSLISLVFELGDEIAVTRLDPDNWLLRPSSASGCQPKLLQAPHLPSPSCPATHHSDEDALPGVAIEPGVFPEDCLELLAHIPTVDVEDIKTGALLKVMVSELYSPSHLWIQRLGDSYQELEELMYEMNVYYRGEGFERRLSVSALRVGYYVACNFKNYWHRALIVRAMDSITVKVRHVDYGAVHAVSTSCLRPLLRRFAALPAQAIRATLGGVRPAAGSARWSHAASLYLLDLVRDRQLMACVQAVDLGSSTLEVNLTDTSGDDDVYLAERLFRAGHADYQPRSSLQSDEGYLLPTFFTLEWGHTLSFSEIQQNLRDGIDIKLLDDYRCHVAPLVPSFPFPPPAPSVALAPSPAEVPFLSMAPLQLHLPLSSPPPSLPLYLRAPRPPNPRVHDLAPEVHKLCMVDSNQYVVDEIVRAQKHNADLPADRSPGRAAGVALAPAWSFPAFGPALSSGFAPGPAWRLIPAPGPAGPNNGGAWRSGPVPSLAGHAPGPTWSAGPVPSLAGHAPGPTWSAGPASGPAGHASGLVWGLGPASGHAGPNNGSAWRSGPVPSFAGHAPGPTWSSGPPTGPGGHAPCLAWSLGPAPGHAGPNNGSAWS